MDSNKVLTIEEMPDYMFEDIFGGNLTQTCLKNRIEESMSNAFKYFKGLVNYCSRLINILGTHSISKNMLFRNIK